MKKLLIDTIITPHDNAISSSDLIITGASRSAQLVMNFNTAVCIAERH